MRIRPVLARLHRYAGLSLAAFLIVAGLTGSIIAFDDELDSALNPELFTATTKGPALGASALAARVEAQLPGTSVTLVPLSLEPGEAALMRVDGASTFDQVFADPVSGKVLGTRLWGAAKLSRANLIPFIYLLHYSLQLPGVWGILLMGIMACLWVIDSFVGFALTLPRGKPFWTKWSTSWRIKRGAGSYRLNLDLHRAGGLWLWLLLIMMSVSAVSLNLPEQVFRPVLGAIVKLSPSPLEIAAQRPAFDPNTKRLDYDAAIAAARADVIRSGRSFLPHNAFYIAAYGAYGVGFSRAGENGEDGMGNSFLYIDAASGKVLARQIMGQGTPGDVFAQAQFALHSGHILGLPGRILIALLGLAVAGLSGTGIYIWARKTHQRLRRPRQSATIHPLAQAAE